jgi:hypothetical protein
MIQEAAQTVIASVGDHTILPCVTSGVPTPDITWYFDRRRINPRDPKYRQREDGSLVITSVEVGHGFSRILRWQMPRTYCELVEF